MTHPISLPPHIEVKLIDEAPRFRDGGAARRPKPPSLKQQALNLLPDRPGGIAMKCTLHPDDIELLRRALESLPDAQG